MDPEPSHHELNPDSDHQLSLLAPTRTMELTCGLGKPGEATEMADIPAAVPAEEQVAGALPPQDQQSYTEENQANFQLYQSIAALDDDSEQDLGNSIPNQPRLVFGSTTYRVEVGANCGVESEEETEGSDMNSDVDVDSDGGGDESEQEMQDSDMDSDVDVGDNDEVSHAATPSEQSEPIDELYEQFLSELGPGHEGIHNDPNDDQRSIFVDFDDGPDADSETVSTGDESDTDTDVTASSLPLVYHDASPHVHSTPNLEWLATETPNLERLLHSSGTPGRGLYELELALDHEEHRVTELEKIRRYVEAALRTAQSRQSELRAAITASRSKFSEACTAAGISDELWREYEAFCESLEPRFGSRGGWSVTCFEDHGGSYVGYDPDLVLFVQSAEMPLGCCNFRCEASIVKSFFSQPDEYVVEFWPLASPEPRIGDETTWGEQCPNLYHLATLAANNAAQSNRYVASELLSSLSDQHSSFSGGWLFEYHPEHARSRHPVKSRQWSYRSAHRINVLADQRQVEGVENVDGSDLMSAEVADEQQD